MPLTTNCPSCRKAIGYPEQYAGRTLGCPHCKSPVATPPLPKPAAARPAAPAAVPRPVANPPASVRAPAPRAPAPQAPRKPSPPVATGASPPGVSKEELQSTVVLARCVLGGAAVIFAAVVGTALLQMYAMSDRDVELHWTVAEWLLMLLTSYSAGSVAFAMLARWLGGFVILLGAGLACGGIFLAIPRAKAFPRLLLFAAGAAIGMGALLAVSMPTVVSILGADYAIEMMNRPPSLWDATPLLVKLILLAAVVAFLAAAGILLYHLRAVARARGDKRLAGNFTVYLLALVGTNLGLFLLAAVGEVGVGLISSTYAGAQSLLGMTTPAVFFLWTTASIVFLLWGFNLQAKLAFTPRPKISSGAKSGNNADAPFTWGDN